MYIDILRWFVPGRCNEGGYIFISRCPVDTVPVAADENGYLAPQHVGEFTLGSVCRGFQSPCKPFEYRPLIYYLIWSVFCMQMRWGGVGWR